MGTEFFKIEEKKAYAIALGVILVILALVVKIVLSNNAIEKARLELAALNKECETLQKAMEHPKVTEGPTATRTVTTIKYVPGKTEVVYAEDGTVNDMAKKLLGLGYVEWNQVEEIIRGGRTSEPVYPELRKPEPEKRLNNTVMLEIDALRKTAGYSRRLYGTLEAGVTVNIYSDEARPGVLVSARF